MNVRLRLTHYGYKIDEIVTQGGAYITWGGTYSQKENAIREIRKIRKDFSEEDLKTILMDAIRQEDEE